MLNNESANNSKCYQCQECGFFYREEAQAQKCEEWCREHKSCNIDITKDAVKTEKALFAVGCFWGVEDKFMGLNGVLKTTAGYIGGRTKNPTYEQVCLNQTGHAECVSVVFDPSIISYTQLLGVFWNTHDPTQLNRQGPDIGSQYRSAIFYYNDEQKKFAEKSKNELEKSGKYANPIVTEIVPASPFYKAEKYHQRYLKKHGLSACLM